MGTVIQNSDEIKKLLEQTDPDYVSLTFDSGHLLFSGIDPCWFLDTFISRIGQVIFQDLNRSVLTQISHRLSYYDSVMEGIFCTPGKGMIPFSHLMQTLAKAKYKDWILVQAEQDPKKNHPFTNAKQANHYLEKLLLKATKQNLR